MIDVCNETKQIEIWGKWWYWQRQ